MKKYTRLADLIIDYRSFKGLSQLDLSVLLDVDTRTVSRWEKGTTLLNPLIKEGFVKKLHLPHQVIHNLNSSVPIPVFYDIEYRTYSLDSINNTVPRASWLNVDLHPEKGRVQLIDPSDGIEIFNSVQGLRVSPKKVSQELLEEAVRILPELNVVLKDNSGYYSGHFIILNLKYEIYLKLRNREMNEEEINATHLTINTSEDSRVLYLYVANADSLSDIYYLMNYLFSYFKKNEIKNYYFALTESKESNIEIFKEIGLQEIWVNDDNLKGSLTLLEGNFDKFLFDEPH